MKRRISIATIVIVLLALVSVGLWAGSRFVYANQSQGQAVALVANVAATADVDGEDGKEASREEVSDNNEAGIVITAVEPDGPADEAGVKRGNILLQIDETEVNTLGDVAAHLDALEVGDQVTLNVLHGDEARTLTVTTGERNGRAYLGITSCDGIEQLIEKEIIIEGDMPFPHDFEDFDFSEFATHTLIVEDVMAGEAAEVAGLQVGDQILALNGESAETGEAFVAALTAHSPGDSVTLTIQRDGEAERREVEVTLGDNGEGQAFLGIALGVDVEVDIEMEMDGHGPMMPGFDFDEQDLPEGQLQGAVIAKVKEDSAAAAAGLLQGDVITAVEGQTLANLDDLMSALGSLQPNDTITLTIWRKGETLEIEVTLGQNENGKAQLGAQVGFVSINKISNGNEVEIEEEITIDSSTK